MTGLSDIKGYVSEVRGVRVSDIEGPRRFPAFTRPRQEVMYLARHFTGLSLPAIGHGIGRRDHTTVLHGIRATERRITEDASYAAQIDNMKVDIGNWKPRFFRHETLMFKSRRVKS